jgi:hypothetical protein
MSIQAIIKPVAVLLLGCFGACNPAELQQNAQKKGEIRDDAVQVCINPIEFQLQCTEPGLIDGITPAQFCTTGAEGSDIAVMEKLQTWLDTETGLYLSFDSPNSRVLANLAYMNGHIVDMVGQENFTDSNGFMRGIFISVQDKNRVFLNTYCVAE